MGIIDWLEKIAHKNIEKEEEKINALSKEYKFTKSFMFSKKAILFKADSFFISEDELNIITYRGLTL